jgi:hypothetical protein
MRQLPAAMVPTHPRTLFYSCFTEIRRPSEGEENDLLAGYGANVMVRGYDLDAGDLLDHRLHDWTGRFNQMAPYLLQQVPPPFGWKRLGQLLLGFGQNASEANHEKIAEQVDVDVLGAPADVILLEATDSLADGSFDLTPGSHGNLSTPMPVRAGIV